MLATVYQGTNLFTLQAERIEWIEKERKISKDRLKLIPLNFDCETGSFCCDCDCVLTRVR